MPGAFGVHLAVISWRGDTMATIGGASCGEILSAGSLNDELFGLAGNHALLGANGSDTLEIHSSVPEVVALTIDPTDQDAWFTLGRKGAFAFSSIDLGAVNVQGRDPFIG
jgi:hypothetical protein